MSYEEMPIEDLSFLSLHRDLNLSTPLKVKVLKYNEDKIHEFASVSSISKAKSQFLKSAHSRSSGAVEPGWSSDSSDSSSNSEKDEMDLINTVGKRFNTLVQSTQIK